ncbi:fructose-bisphosphate aldolase class I [Candidatus Saccharibacteria bacterium]|nr:fructose-bisphosphate aldolase class I [Candidatus Saccharibacteria bacterium]
MYSTIAATVFSALLSGKSARDALLLAKLNVENSSLNGTLINSKLTELLRDTRETERSVAQIAGSLMRGHKGILAADESGGSIHKKFLAANIPDDESHRRSYRNVLLTAKHLEWYVNGVIMFDETIHQKADNGQGFVEYLTSIGIVPGIKVDQGLVNLPGTSENYTAGLDGLLLRLQDYYDMGLRFAKWRAAFEVKVKDGEVITPSTAAISKNCEILARYAKSCQIAGLVPIVEPEVVHDGDYSIEDCAKITGQILDELFANLHQFDVSLEGCILKCNMVLAGKKYETKSTPSEVAKATSEVLKSHLPDRLAGVVFLSGGQSPESTTANLAAITSAGPYPWPVSFSFARAVQDPALSAWQGDNKNTTKAQKALISRLEANQKALE